MKCSECIKHDVCRNHKDIFQGFSGILRMIFGPTNTKYGEIDEFIGKICERSKYGQE